MTASRPTVREWLQEAPFTLAMSSGFFGFYAHAGVLRVLEDENIVPAQATGSSAGALVTGAFCAGVPARRLCDRLQALQRHEFWDPAPGLGILRGRMFADVLAELLPVSTFAACRIPVAVSVFDIGARDTRVLDEGLLAPAMQASCTVPVMFHPVRHMGRSLYDGGILDRPGLASVKPGSRVFYHHLVSRWLGNVAPRRDNMVGMQIVGLPRADPFRMHHGMRAMDMASRATLVALDRAVVDLVSVSGS